MSFIGGGECTTSTNGCFGQGQCPNLGGSDKKHCKCFDDFVCNHCELTSQEFRDASTFSVFMSRSILLPKTSDNTCPNTTLVPEVNGGGNCTSGVDCTNYAGKCIDGKC